MKKVLVNVLLLLTRLLWKIEKGFDKLNYKIYSIITNINAEECSNSSADIQELYDDAGMILSSSGHYFYPEECEVTGMCEYCSEEHCPNYVPF